MFNCQFKDGQIQPWVIDEGFEKQTKGFFLQNDLDSFKYSGAGAESDLSEK